MYNYWCENIDCRSKCELCDHKGNIRLEKIDSYVCPSASDVQLKLLGESIQLGVGERLKHRPKKEATKRSTDHFKKEIFPTLAKSDKKQFLKKWHK
jgi:hypothetical protein